MLAALLLMLATTSIAGASSVTLRSETAGVRVVDAQSADETLLPSVNDAIMAAQALLPAGGDIRLEAGTYPIDGIVALASDIGLYGAVDASGAPATILVVQDGLPPSFGNVLQATDKERITIENLRIEARDRASYLIEFRCSRDILVRNVDVQYPSDAGFGSSGCTNVEFDDCSTVAHGLHPGYGFAITGSPDGIQDVDTTVRDCRASGFNNVLGGQGLEIRGTQLNLPGAQSCPGGIATVVCSAPGAWPVCIGGINDGLRYCPTPADCPGRGPGTRGLRVIGGEYTDNLVGVWVEDALDPVLVDVVAHDNVNFGLYVAGGPLPDPIQVTVQGGRYQHNGTNSVNNVGSTSGSTYDDVGTAVSWGPSGGIRLIGHDDRIDGAELLDNWPANLVLEDTTNASITGNRFHGCRTSADCPSPPCQAYHVYGFGKSPSGRLVGNAFGGTLFARLGGNDGAVTEEDSALVDGCLDPLDEILQILAAALEPLHRRARTVRIPVALASDGRLEVHILTRDGVPLGRGHVHARARRRVVLAVKLGARWRRTLASGTRPPFRLDATFASGAQRTQASASFTPSAGR